MDGIKSSSWYNGLRGNAQKELQNLFIRSANIPKNKSKIIISDKSTDISYSLTEAETILTTSLKIILENVEYDAYFLEAIIRCYPKIGKEIQTHRVNGWLEYIHGGGENISNVISGLKDRFENQKGVFPKDSYRYVRAFVLLDSDKQYPNDATIKSLHITVKDSRIPYSILAKREKENYLPIEIFDEIIDNINIVNAILRLSPAQLDFFDLEKGFPDQKFTQLDPNIKNLYTSISEDDKTTFRKEKLTFRKNDGKKDSFKSRFSQLFSSNKITKENMEKRADSTDKAELQKILQKIYDLL